MQTGIIGNGNSRRGGKDGWYGWHETCNCAPQDGEAWNCPDFPPWNVTWSVLMFERIQSQAGSVRMHLRGGLDGEASRAMWQGMAALAQVEAREVVIDLTHVSFVDGSGLGAISYLFKRLTARGRALKVVGASGQPLAMLRHLGLASMLGIADDEVRRPLFPRSGLAWAR